MASALNDDILPILLPLIEKGLTNTAGITCIYLLCY